MSSSGRNTESSAGFTLIELMVAMAVVALLFILVSEMSGHTLQATRRSNQQMDAMRGSSAVLDVLGNDLDSAVFRNGATLLLRQTDANNTDLAFITRSRAPNGNSDTRFMAVIYMLEGNKLIRKAKPIPWGNRDLSTAPLEALSASKTSVIYNSVLRFEIVVLLDNGQTVPVSRSGTWISASTLTGEVVRENFSALVLKRGRIQEAKPKAKGIVIAVATLDGQTVLLPGVETIKEKFGSSIDGETLAEKWNAVISKGGISGMPDPVLAAIQVAQKTYLIP